MMVKSYEDNRVIIIASMNKKRYIGKDNSLIHNSKEDLKFFKDKTEGHIVIMGRKTFESIGKPLSNRINIVVSTTYTKEDALKKGIYVEKSSIDALMTAYAILNQFKPYAKYRQDIFIVGGEKVYEELLPYTDEIFLNILKENNIEGDVKFPPITKDHFILKYRNYKYVDFVSYNYKSVNLVKLI